MFKVKKIRTGEICQVLGTYCDEYGKAWFLFWVGDKWCWRPAADYVPPNYVPQIKLIVAGSRDFNNYQLLSKELDQYKGRLKEVVSGMAKGADTLGRNWAITNDIKVAEFPADWTLGNSAGFIRNHQMGDYADELLAFWNGTSSGTQDMIDYMISLSKPVTVIKYTSDNCFERLTY